jgi:hypothetical protein
MSKIVRVEYRVMRHATAAGETFAVHEVFVDADGSLSWTPPLSVACTSVGDLRIELQACLDALSLPVLDRPE